MEVGIENLSQPRFCLAAFTENRYYETSLDFHPVSQPRTGLPHLHESPILAGIGVSTCGHRYSYRIYLFAAHMSSNWLVKECQWNLQIPNLGTRHHSVVQQVYCTFPYRWSEYTQWETLKNLLCVLLYMSYTSNSCYRICSLPSLVPRLNSIAGVLAYEGASWLNSHTDTRIQSKCIAHSLRELAK